MTDDDLWTTFDAHAVRWGAIMRRIAYGCEVDEMLNDLRVRVWRAHADGSFDGRTVGAMVAYANVAARHVAIDALKGAGVAFHRGAHVWAPTCDASMPISLEAEIAPDAPALDAERREWRARFWSILTPMLRTPQERIAVGCFAAGILPKQIVEHRPELFRDAAEVYAAQRRAMNRIKGNDAVRTALARLQEAA